MQYQYMEGKSGQGLFSPLSCLCGFLGTIKFALHQMVPPGALPQQGCALSFCESKKWGGTTTLALSSARIAAGGGGEEIPQLNCSELLRAGHKRWKPKTCLSKSTYLCWLGKKAPNQLLHTYTQRSVCELGGEANSHFGEGRGAAEGEAGGGEDKLLTDGPDYSRQSAQPPIPPGYAIVLRG